MYLKSWLLDNNSVGCFDYDCRGYQCRLFKSNWKEIPNKFDLCNTIATIAPAELKSHNWKCKSVFMGSSILFAALNVKKKITCLRCQIISFSALSTSFRTEVLLFFYLA